MIWSFKTTTRKEEKKCRGERFRCDYFAESLAELSIYINIVKGDLTVNAFLNYLCQEGTK